MRPRARFFAMMLAGLAGWAGAAGAGPSMDHGGASPVPAAPIRLAYGGISLDQAVQMAQARYGARVVRADTERDGDRVYYRLRLLSPDGRVFSVRVDAQTGSMSQ
jgi:hypothetical protein